MLMSGERENDPKDGDTRKYNEAKWQLFKEHHYMDAKLSSSATCFLARWGRLPVGFVAVMCQPATLPKDEPRILWREHRLVVLPDFQGLGIGSRLSDATGSLFLLRGRRYSSRSAHFVLREQRRSSPRWSEDTVHQGAAQDFMGNFGGKKGGSRPRGAQVKAATASGGKKARLSHDSDDEDEEKRLTYRFVYVGDEREQRLSLLAARGVDISSELRVDAMVEEAAAVAAAAADSSSSDAAGSGAPNGAPDEDIAEQHDAARLAARKTPPAAAGRASGKAPAAAKAGESGNSVTAGAGTKRKSILESITEKQSAARM